MPQRLKGQVLLSSACDNCCLEGILNNRYFHIQPIDLRFSFTMTQHFCGFPLTYNYHL